MDHNGGKRYSTALFEVAKTHNKIEQFLDELQEVSSILKENARLAKILNHPVVQIKDKRYIVNTAFHGRIDNEIINLMMVLIEHGKINELTNIIFHYRDIVYNYKGIKVATATTAVKMTSEEIDMLKKRLENQYGCKIIVENPVDPEIIGGVYLKVGDEAIDGTIRGNFEKMEKELLKFSFNAR
jgi:F-type H+-transporting ATPase subunit delta